MVTVSQKLCRELNARYLEVETIEEASLPPIKVLTFRELIDDLGTYSKLGDQLGTKVCTFIQYVNAEKFYDGIGVDDLQEAESKYSRIGCNADYRHQTHRANL